MAATFGATLASHLAERGWSQREFAARVGVSQSLLARIIGGSRRPVLAQIPLWIDELGLSATAASELVGLAMAEHDAEPLLDLHKPSRRAADRGPEYDRG